MNGDTVLELLRVVTGVALALAGYFFKITWDEIRSLRTRVHKVESVTTAHGVEIENLKAERGG